MRHFIRLFASVAVIVIVLANTALASSVYKVSKGDNTLYLGGTIHILTADDYPLDKAYTEAFARAEEIYFETDIEAMNSRAFQLQTMPLMFQQPGNKLNDVLSEEVQLALSNYLSERSIPDVQIQNLTPAGAMLVLTITEFQMRGFTQEGVDQYFFNQSKAAGKTVGWLESLETQLNLIRGFNEMDPDELITYTLSDITKADETIGALHEAWKKGDMQALFDAGLSSWILEYPEVYDDIMVKRNNAWHPQIKKMLEDAKVEYVLVGALHLAGEDGLLNLLRKDGYKLEIFTP